MNFCIQVSNPKFQNNIEIADKSLSDAIESSFPLNTENAILTWNCISIPLSYKYDISYMMDDILNMLYSLCNKESGEMEIHWLPDTFRCDWKIQWKENEVKIYSHWECTVGYLENLLNKFSYLILSKNEFVSEWKELLHMVIKALKNCGYNEKKIKDMSRLLNIYYDIKETGKMYI